MRSRRRQLQTIIRELTPHGCELLSFYESKSKRSYYCIYYKPPVYFKVIRISDHKSYKRTFDIPTFIWTTESDLPALNKELKSYIDDNSAWFAVKYHEFVVLDYIWNRRRRNYSIHLDGEYFGGDTIIFYADVYSGKRVKRHSFSDRFSKGLKKFYGRGIINYYYEDRNKLIKLTTLGVELYKIVKKVYSKFWKKDRRKLNIYSFELPESNPSRSSLKAKKVENIADEPKVTETVPVPEKTSKSDEITLDSWKSQASVVWDELKKLFKMSVDLIKKIINELTSEPDLESVSEEVSEAPKETEEKVEKEKVNIKKEEKVDVMKSQVQNRTKHSLGAMVSDDTMSQLSALKDMLENEEK